MKFSILFFWLASIVAGSGLFAPVHITTPAAKDSKQPVKKVAANTAGASRVWTNEDLPAVRKPWDNYLEQKAAEEAVRTAAEKSEEEKRAKAAKDTRNAGSAMAADLAPHTVEEAETRIRDKQIEIAYQKELISRTRDEYGKAVEENIRQSIIKKLEMLDTDLDAAYAELKELQAQLDDMNAKGQPQPAVPQSANR
jgi:hypothetical protein